jgi:DNA-binding MarR family transcriptional regulator
MTVNLSNIPPASAPTAGPEGRLYLREEELDRAAALIFEASRAFWAAASGPLSEKDLGPAHYRALAAIRRQEGLSVGSLQDLLGVRKQSLQRVLGEIEDAGLIVRVVAPGDRRQRQLRLTDAGRSAEQAVSAALRERLLEAFRLAGADAVAGARRVLGLIAEMKP